MRRSFTATPSPLLDTVSPNKSPVLKPRSSGSLSQGMPSPSRFVLAYPEELNAFQQPSKRAKTANDGLGKLRRSMIPNWPGLRHSADHGAAI
jgi:hypothetical protein